MGEADLYEYDLGRFSRDVTTIRDLVSIYDLAIYNWDNDWTCSGALERITTVGLYHNITHGATVYVTSVDMAIITANKDCTFELGYTAADNGAGAFTAITPRWSLDRGAASSAGTLQHRVWTIPIKVVWVANTVECITFQVNGADALTHIMVAWKGWER